MPPQETKFKKILLPILALVVLTGIVFLGLKGRTHEAPPSKSDTGTAAKEWPSEQVRRETITDNTKGYDIVAYYPITQSEGITALMRDFALDQISAFKVDTAAAGELPEGFPAMTLDISYEEYQNDRADNYVFTIYSDTGGAHGLQATKTFVFGRTGQQIALGDLFTNGTQGLGSIADYVQGELKKREFADSAWIEEGAAPNEGNYQNFTIENTGVSFIFDPYQVAPYAAGKQTVLVPTSAFKSIANPELFR